MAGKHLPGDLRIPGLVGAYQAKPISAEDRHQSIEQEKGGKNEKADGLQGVVQARETSFQRLQTGALADEVLEAFPALLFSQPSILPGGRTTTPGGCSKTTVTKRDAKKKEPDIGLRPQGYQIHRPGERRTCRGGGSQHEKRRRRLIQAGKEAAFAIAVRRCWRIRSVATGVGRPGCSRWHFRDRRRQTAPRWWPRSPGPCCAG